MPNGFLLGTNPVDGGDDTIFYISNWYNNNSVMSISPSTGEADLLFVTDEFPSTLKFIGYPPGLLFLNFGQSNTLVSLSGEQLWQGDEFQGTSMCKNIAGVAFHPR